MSYNKWNSRRWRITLWAMATATLLMGYSVAVRYEPSWLGIALPLLVAIPTAYIAAESYTKTHIKGE